MHTLRYHYRARFERWLYREKPGWVSQQIAAHLVHPVQGLLRPTPRRLTSSEVPTIVVGSLTFGGAGKTPIAASIAQDIAQRFGLTVGLVCRGWRGTVNRPRQVTGVNARQDGDEAAMLMQRQLPGVSIWAGRSLERARLLASPLVDVVVVDDGLQTPDLGRTHSIAVVDSTAPQALVPAGPYRVAFSTLADADLIWCHKTREPEAKALPPPWEADVSSEYTPSGVVLPDGTRRPPSWLAGRSILAVCGIGRPQSFMHQLESLGAKIIDGLILGDHHSPSRGMLERLPNGVMVVTTEKDATRWPAGVRPVVLEVGVSVLSGSKKLSAWLTQVCGQ